MEEIIIDAYMMLLVKRILDSGVPKSEWVKASADLFMKDFQGFSKRQGVSTKDSGIKETVTEKGEE